MNKIAKFSIVSGAAAMLLTAAVGVSPVRAQAPPPPPSVQPISPATGSVHHQRHMMFDQRQQRDYRAKNREIDAENQRVDVQKHKNELTFRSQDSKLNDQEKAFAAAHGGHVSKEEIARLDARRDRDKARDLAHAHHDDYRALAVERKATSRYDASKAHIHSEENK